jgi:hypothetical protein
MPRASNVVAFEPDAALDPALALRMRFMVGVYVHDPKANGRPRYVDCISTVAAEISALAPPLDRIFFADPAVRLPGAPNSHERVEFTQQTPPAYGSAASFGAHLVSSRASDIIRRQARRVSRPEATPSPSTRWMALPPVSILQKYARAADPSAGPPDDAATPNDIALLASALRTVCMHVQTRFAEMLRPLLGDVTNVGHMITTHRARVRRRGKRVSHVYLRVVPWRWFHGLSASDKWRVVKAAAAFEKLETSSLISSSGALHRLAPSNKPVGAQWAEALDAAMDDGARDDDGKQLAPRSKLWWKLETIMRLNRRVHPDAAPVVVRIGDTLTYVRLWNDADLLPLDDVPAACPDTDAVVTDIPPPNL